MSRVNSFLAWCLLVSAPAPLLSQDALQDLSGTWTGTLADHLEMVLRVSREADAYVATFDSVTQSAFGLKVKSFTFTESRVLVVLADIPASYSAKLSDDGKEMVGTWKQSGSLPLTLRRTEQPIPPLARPQEPKPPFPYASESAVFHHEDDLGKVTLAGTLTLPRGKGPHPAVVLISGSGQQDRDETLMGHRPFLVLADHLTRQGIAVLRYDDRGVGGSRGEVTRATTAHFANDAAAALRWLATRPEVDAKALGLIGHSEGGLIAPLVAKMESNVAFLVLLAAPGVDGRAILGIQNRLALEATDTPPEWIEKTLALNSRVYDLVGAGPPGLLLRAKLSKELGSFFDSIPEAERKTLGARKTWVRGQVDQVSSPWFTYFLGHDPVTVLRATRCPVLAINGTKDLQVDAEQNLPPIASALRDAGNTDVTIERLDGLNHLFQTAKTGAVAEYVHIEETFAPVALTTVTHWITKRFPARP